MSNLELDSDLPTPGGMKFGRYQAGQACEEM